MALLTCITFCKTFILWLDQSDCVVDIIPVQTPMHSGRLLVNLGQIFHVLVLRFHLLPQAWVPPRPAVLRQSFEQRGEDAAIRVLGEVVQVVQRIRAGKRGSNQWAAAVDQQH